jgi:hypothetical protein
MPPEGKKKKQRGKKNPLSRQLATPNPTLLQLSSAENRENLATDKFPTPLHSRPQLNFLPLPTSFK